MLSYLRAQLRKAEKCKLMKMIIVGPPRQGKSTLLEILQTGRAPQVVHSEATIRTTKWELQRPAGSRAKVKDGRRAESPWVGGSFPGPLLSLLQRAWDIHSLVSEAQDMYRGRWMLSPNQLLPRAVNNFLIIS